MTKPVRLRRIAAADVETIVDHLLDNADVETANRFVDTFERIVSGIGRHPHQGSLSLAHELDIPGLRFRRISGFAHLIFDIEGDQYVDVWRILHERRDLPATFVDEPGSQ